MGPVRQYLERQAKDQFTLYDLQENNFTDSPIQYKKNIFEKLGGICLRPIAYGMSQWDASGSVAKRVWGCVALLFTSWIGLIGFCLNELGEWGNAQSKNRAGAWDCLQEKNGAEQGAINKIMERYNAHVAMFVVSPVL